MRAEPPPIPLLVVVTGPAAGGKTIARGLAAQVRLPLLEREAIDVRAVAELVRGALQASYAP